MSMTLAPTPLARKSSLKMPEKAEKRATRSFFGRTSKPVKATTPLRTLSVPIDVSKANNDHGDETEGSNLSTSLSTASQRSSTLGAVSEVESGDPRALLDACRPVSHGEGRDVVVNTRTSSIGAVNSVSLLSNQLQEMEIRRKTLMAAKDSSLSPVRVEHRRPSGPRQLADWDIYPSLEEEELIDGFDTESDFTLNSPNSHTSADSSAISSPVAAPRSRNKRASLDSFFIHSRKTSTTSFADESNYGSAGSPTFLDLKSPVTSSFKPTLHDIKDVRDSIAPLAPFQRTLSTMENSGLKNICRRLSEDWEGANEEQVEEVAFEKRIWAIIASQWLTFGKQLQSPGHGLLSNARVTDGRKVLHLHGPAVDGWVLAAKYSNSTVYSVSSQNITNPSNSWTSPTNHHMLFIPAVSSPIPFPDNYFDVVVTRTLSSVLKADELDSVLRESYRILRPGGWIELHTIDPTLTRAGDITKRWIESRILVPMEDNFFSVRPSDRILQLMNELGYKSVKNARIALPARSGDTDADGQKLMVHLGRHFYEELYGQFLRAGHIGEGSPQWWWNSKAVKQECERSNTCFGLTISFGRKA